MQLAIVDSGAGNVKSVYHALVAAGAEPVIARDAEAIQRADRLILPGVGAAGAVAKRLATGGLSAALHEAVRQRGRPMLGICLGMQLLAERLLEFGEHQGLGWIAGKVMHLRDAGVKEARVPPDTGWNVVDPDPLQLVSSAPRHELVPSTSAIPTRLSRLRLATWPRARRMVYLLSQQCWRTRCLRRSSTPEKSQVNGQRLIRAFLNWSP